jgi:hypothetical protein
MIGAGDLWFDFMSCEALFIPRGPPSPELSIDVGKSFWAEKDSYSLRKSDLYSRIDWDAVVCLKSYEGKYWINGAYSYDKGGPFCSMETYQIVASARRSLQAATSSTDCISAMRTAMATAPSSFDDNQGYRAELVSSMAQRCPVSIARDDFATLAIDLVNAREFRPENVDLWFVRAYQGDTIRDVPELFIVRQLIRLLSSPDEVVRCVADYKLARRLAVEPLSGTIRQCEPGNWTKRISFWQARLAEMEQKVNMAGP